MQNTKLSADARRTIARSAELRAEFEAMPSAELQQWHAGYSKFIEAAWSAEAAERYLEKVHIIECIISERLEAVAEMVSEVEESEEVELEAEDFDGNAQAAREAADFEAEELAREAAEEAAFEKMMEAFETQIEDEEIAELRQQARELAEEEEAAAELRRRWEWGQEPPALRWAA